MARQNYPPTHVYKFAAHICFADTRAEADAIKADADAYINAQRANLRPATIKKLEGIISDAILDWEDFNS